MPQLGKVEDFNIEVRFVSILVDDRERRITMQISQMFDQVVATRWKQLADNNPATRDEIRIVDIFL
jgi:hypothetical protein